MPKSPKEMGEAIARNLPAKTGKTFDQWVAIAKEAPAGSRKERVAWLKSEHQLGTVTATFIAAESEGRSIVSEYGDEGALLDAMYSGERAPLRPLYDQLAKAAKRLGKDVDLTVCKTYVGIRRGKQFAMVKPWKARVDLGLVLKGAPYAGRLVDAGPIGSERMTHRIAISSQNDIDAEVKDALRRAYEAAL